MESQVKKFYKDKTIFITGATGMLGHLTAEKLLRCCAVKRIYLLVRDKRNKTSKERIDQMFENELFHKMKEVNPDFKRKIVGLNGDCILENLGLTETNHEELCKNVNIVFHCDENINMAGKLSHLIRDNVKGTTAVLDLCHQMDHLQALVYVSTAYSNSNQEEIEEKIYKPIISGSFAVELLENVNGDALKFLAPTLTAEFPNAYTFSKHLAEDLIQDEIVDIPTAIFRPPIIIPTHEDPVAGWINNLQGPSGIFCTIMGGILRVVNLDDKMKPMLMFADTCVSGLLAIAWETAQSPQNSIKVYDFVRSNESSPTTKQYLEANVDVSRKYPLRKALWYPVVTQAKTDIMYRIKILLYHYIPGFIYDVFFFLSRKKHRLIPIYNRFTKVNKILEAWKYRNCVWKPNNVKSLWNKMEVADREWLKFDLDGMNTMEAFINSMIGTRYYLLKDRPDTLNAARKRMKILKIVHYFTTTTLKVLGVLLIYQLHLKVLKNNLPLRKLANKQHFQPIKPSLIMSVVC